MSSETDINEYINFDIEVVISLPAINSLMLDWRQKTLNRSMADASETSEATAEEASQPEEEPEILTNEDENR